MGAIYPPESIITAEIL